MKKQEMLFKHKDFLKKVRNLIEKKIAYSRGLVQEHEENYAYSLVFVILTVGGV